MKATTQHSSYWLDKDLFNDEPVNEGLDINRIARLASVRRAVANFVSILSGKNVPVEYSSGKQSYTDGDRVVIAAEDDPSKFDVMVGLALHEGSHVLLTDFSFLQGIMNIHDDLTMRRPPTNWRPNKDSYRLAMTTRNVTLLRDVLPDSLLAVLGTAPYLQPYMTIDDEEAYRLDPYWSRAQHMLTHLKDIMNILEDRRIDKYVYQHAQGYRPYYDALYAKYFFTSEIGKNLRFNPEWREITIENYINRLLFAFHPAASRTAMPGLSKLYDLLDIRTIERLAPSVNPVHMTKVPSFDECPALWKDACKIYEHILAFTGMALKQETAPAALPNSLEEMLQDLADRLSDNLPNLDLGRMQPVPVEKDVKGKGKNQQEVEGKFNEKKVRKELDEAKKVMANALKKKSLKKSEREAVDALEQADAKMVDLKGDGIPHGKCMVTRKVTKGLLSQDWFIFGRPLWNRSPMEAAIAAGRRMGAILHHRLQVRNDPVMTKQTRLPHGGLDRRLLAQLGMDITSVFHRTRVDSHKPVVLHLSLDASGSMSGKKWNKVVTVAVAIAYLSTKLQNVECVISIRGGADLPLVAILFDSKKDQFASFLQTMRQISPAGSTPEGLAFKATMDLILEHATTHDVYFINFSDGEPAFGWSERKGGPYVSYGGDLAANHTRTQIRTMRDAGVKVLSYFIAEGTVHPTAKRLFNIMYGTDASFVDVQNAGEVLRTLNKLLLSRGA